jgi:hypothetical protein
MRMVIVIYKDRGRIPKVSIIGKKMLETTFDLDNKSHLRDQYI